MEVASHNGYRLSLSPDGIPSVGHSLCAAFAVFFCLTVLLHVSIRVWMFLCAHTYIACLRMTLGLFFSPSWPWVCVLPHAGLLRVVFIKTWSVMSHPSPLQSEEELLFVVHHSFSFRLTAVVLLFTLHGEASLWALKREMTCHPSVPSCVGVECSLSPRLPWSSWLWMFMHSVTSWGPIVFWLLCSRWYVLLISFWDLDKR